MANLQTRDLLERALKFHHDLRLYYQALEAEEQQQRVRLLLDYMQHHEAVLEHALKAYALGAPPAVLNAWFKNAPEVPVQTWLQNNRLHSNMSVQEVIRMALQLDDHLLAVYRQLASLPLAEPIRNLFIALLEEESQEQRRLARDAIEFAFD